LLYTRTCSGCRSTASKEGGRGLVLGFLFGYAGLWIAFQLLHRLLFRGREEMPQCSASAADSDAVRSYKRYACAAMVSAGTVVIGIVVARFAGWLTTGIAVHALGLALGFLSVANGLSGWRHGLHPIPSGYGTSFIMEPVRTWRAWILLAGGLASVVLPAVLLLVESGAWR
jgi:hypothetical protein